MGNCEIAGEITALQCSQRCIKAFGGDPDRVTIFGPSAGAGAFRALLGSPPAIALSQYSDMYSLIQRMDRTPSSPVSMIMPHATTRTPRF